MITAAWLVFICMTFAASHFPILVFGEEQKQKIRCGMQDSLVIANLANGKCSRSPLQQQGPIGKEYVKTWNCGYAEQKGAAVTVANVRGGTAETAVFGFIGSHRRVPDDD